jgi:8-oxo-dGTP pyrophosphatase MutT (NUDIX family)
MSCERRGAVTLEEIRAALGRVPHEPAPFAPEPHHAAVAMVLCEDADGLAACFIRRAERPGDRWSGQVAFPGGRAEPGDGSAAAVAERETWEEVGLRLVPRYLVGPLPVQAVGAGGLPNGMTLSPFLYHVGPEARRIAHPRIRQEVQSVFWVPLRHLFDEHATTELDYPYPGAGTFPGIRFDEHVIWGLTLRVLGTFASLLERRLPALG